MIISTGEDGNLILYNLNHSQDNDESKIIFRDEVLVKEIILKEKVFFIYLSFHKNIVLLF